MTIPSTYQKIMFGRCAVGHEDEANSVGALIGRTGVGPAFGGEFGIKLRPIGGDAQTHWGTFHFIRGLGEAAVIEFASAGPYPTLNGVGLTNEQIAALKAVLTVAAYPRETQERGFWQWLADTGYEVMP